MRGEKGVLLREVPLREPRAYTAICSDSLKSSHLPSEIPSPPFMAFSSPSEKTSMDECLDMVEPPPPPPPPPPPREWIRLLFCSTYKEQSPFLRGSLESIVVDKLRLTPPPSPPDMILGEGELRCLEQRPHFCDSFQHSSTPQRRRHCLPLNFFLTPSGVTMISPFFAPL